MSTATTIAPALKPMRAPIRRIERRQATTTGVEAPEPAQHMQALARANEVRLARAALKREIAAGSHSVLEVVLECPWQVRSMSVSELLSAQRRWGKARSRKLIQSAGLKETKELGSMTERQRRVLVHALEAKATA
ncbi:MAG: hypothetical protein M3O25_04765 [Actinomycetota bacterium]|nr:hypothetical protein [Actinomycetota bacterium]